MGKSIRFAEMCEPSLKAGTYEIQMEPVTTIDCQLASEIVEFTVATERFHLPPNQVYSVYPPREAVGNYERCLPHIVLHRRTLPWEKRLLPHYPHMPWVALLVFDEAETVQMKESTCAEALQPEAGVFVPALSLQTHEKNDDACMYIHVPVPLLTSILPYGDALSLLAHGKGVSLDRKVTDATVQDNWFATVIANRYNREPVDEHPVRHTACLVSLEGYEACLDNEPKRREALAGYEQARMIVLASWSFSMSQTAFDFSSTVSSLDAAILSTPYGGSQAQVKQLCKLGYFPLNHHIRDGSKAVSWYQPPLIPYEQQRSETKCKLFADQWLAYDPGIGMLDIRYASAWQLGKSMALADRAYAQRLYAWRQQNKQLVRTARYREILSRHLTPDVIAPSVDAIQGRAMVDSDGIEMQSTEVQSAPVSLLATSFLHAARNDQQIGIADSGKLDVLKQLNARYASILSGIIGGLDDETMGK
ncbi:hypothetical protein [Paenibacillus campi]|uniref:hypothetical protein n=1 Tax=Paenibacillus campi TaxID=3106031 RepID=UPI002AFE4E9C|nr:hypothetical protein [Paenibacillus sp. SGZ-1014]